MPDEPNQIKSMIDAIALETSDIRARSKDERVTNESFLGLLYWLLTAMQEIKLLKECCADLEEDIASLKQGSTS